MLVLEKDIKKALFQLKEPTNYNTDLVFKVVHYFNKEREWLSNAVDNWLRLNKMVLINNVNERKRQHPTDRGGFGVVGRLAKNQMIKGLTKAMIKKVGWCVSTCNNSKSIRTIYTERRTSENSGINIKYYVVTKSAEYTEDSSDDDNNDHDHNVDENNQVEAQNRNSLIELDSCFDYSNIASIMTEKIRNKRTNRCSNGCF